MNFSFTSKVSPGARYQVSFIVSYAKHGSAVARQALLRNVMDMHRVRLSRGIREHPLFSRAEHWPGIDTVWIESESVDCPVTRLSGQSSSFASLKAHRYLEVGGALRVLSCHL